MKKLFKNKKLLIIIGVILFLLLVGGIIGFIEYQTYLKKLDGRDCLTCPYKKELSKDDLLLVTDKVSGGYSTAKYKVEVYTNSNNIKVDGEVKVTASCKFNYCFRAMFGTTCQWNYEPKATTTLNFNESNSETDMINISVYGAPTSVYNYLNSSDCKLTISEVNGTLLTYKN